MKLYFIILLGFICTIFYSCESNVLSTNNLIEGDEKFNLEHPLSSTAFSSLVREHIESKTGMTFTELLRRGNQGSSSLRTASPRIEGPFTIEASPVLVDQDILISIDYIPQLDSGIYVCDTYQFLARIPLPDDALLIFQDSAMAPLGTGIGVSRRDSGEIGTSIRSFPFRVEIITWQINVNYSLEGERIDQTFPDTLINTEFNYFVFFPE